jgi:hypothetical protein
MASTYSTNLALELIGTGEQSGTWGTTTNTNLGTLLEQAISGYVTQAITDGSGANTTITIPNGTTGVARNMFIEMTGALTFATTSLIVPANKKMYFIFNNTSGGFAVTVKVSGQTGILVPNGKKVILTCNGTDIVEAHTAIVGNATMGGTLASGTITVSSDMVIATGSITSASGAIDFGNENLSTTGTLASGVLTVTGAASTTGTLGSLSANSYTGASRASTTGFTRVHNIEGTDCSLQLWETTTGTSWEVANDNTGQFRILNGGINRLTITAAGTLSATGTYTSIGTAATSKVALNATSSTTAAHVITMSNTTGTLRMGVVSSAGGGLFTGAPAYSTAIGTDGATSFVLGTNGVSRVTISSAGAVAATVSVSAATGLTGGSSTHLGAGSGSFIGNASSNAAFPALDVGNAATTGDNLWQRFYTEAGYTTQRGSIDFNRAGGLTRYNTTSDGTLKTILGDAPQDKSVGILKSTRLREFFWNEDSTKHAQIGPIAQELHTTFKGAVSVGGWTEEEEIGDGEDRYTRKRYIPWGVDKTAFTFHLVAGWQAHEEQIANLTERLAALEGK